MSLAYGLGTMTATTYGSSIFSDGCLLVSQVSFNSLLYFKKYAPYKLFIAKIQEGK